MVKLQDDHPNPSGAKRKPGPMPRTMEKATICEKSLAWSQENVLQEWAIPIDDDRDIGSVINRLVEEFGLTEGNDIEMVGTGMVLEVYV